MFTRRQVGLKSSIRWEYNEVVDGTDLLNAFRFQNGTDAIYLYAGNNKISQFTEFPSYIYGTVREMTLELQNNQIEGWRKTYAID